MRIPICTGGRILSGKGYGTTLMAFLKGSEQCPMLSRRASQTALPVLVGSQTDVEPRRQVLLGEVEFQSLSEQGFSKRQSVNFQRWRIQVAKGAHKEPLPPTFILANVYRCFVSFFGLHSGSIQNEISLAILVTAMNPTWFCR